MNPGLGTLPSQQSGKIMMFVFGSPWISFVFFKEAAGMGMVTPSPTTRSRIPGGLHILKLKKGPGFLCSHPALSLSPMGDAPGLSGAWLPWEATSHTDKRMLQGHWELPHSSGLSTPGLGVLSFSGESPGP